MVVQIHTAFGEWALYGGRFTLPSQVGNAGKYLKTDGTALQWAEVSGGGGGSTTLAGLTDVSDTTATNGQSLVYNDGEWQPATTVDVNTEEYALAGAGGTADFTAYGLYGNNATDVITGIIMVVQEIIFLTKQQ